MAYVDIKDLMIDKEFEDLLPVLTLEELEKLENSILQKHNIEWHYWQDYKIMGELETRDDVKQWMLEQQLGRRNLSPEERYDIVQKFKSIFQKRAKENQSAGGKGKSNLREVNVQKEMAKATQLSVGSYYKLDYVKKSDNEEVKQQLHDKKYPLIKPIR